MRFERARTEGPSCPHHAHDATKTTGAIVGGRETIESGDNRTIRADDLKDHARTVAPLRGATVTTPETGATSESTSTASDSAARVAKAYKAASDLPVDMKESQTEAETIGLLLVIVLGRQCRVGANVRTW